ncbi:hypothetical protein LOZ53_005475 [Ophidiomyces ophidiicola]|nr:hypothetical protein LOZ53_005475 [Ophidiomyces ophidiicola]
MKKQPAGPEVRFYYLSDGVTISTPSSNGPGDGSSKPGSRGPELILLASWMAAKPEHVGQFASEYRSRYPNATIVHMACSVQDMLFTPTAKKRTELHPVADIIQAVTEQDVVPQASDGTILPISERKHRPRILLHLFSNGGAYMTSQLARVYREKAKSHVPVDAVVLDSTPGVVSYSGSLYAIMSSLANAPTLIRLVGGILARLFLIFLWFIQKLGNGDVLTQARHDLNDETLINKKASRLYLYSEEDAMVRCEDIEFHILEARKCGGKVRKELFHGSGHVAHVTADQKRYWKAVENIWKKMVKAMR